MGDEIWDPASTDGLSEDWVDDLQSRRASSTVLRTPFGLLFTSYDDVSTLASDVRLKVPVVEQYLLLGIEGPLVERARRVILGLDGEPHKRLRSLVNRVFTPKAVAGLSTSMGEFVRARLAAAGGPRIDLLHDVVSGYPARVIGGMLGVPEADLPKLEAAADAITKAQFSLSLEAVDELASVAFEMDDHLRALVATKRAHPGDDLLSRLVETEVDGDRLGDEEIISITASVLNAGMDTTRHQACLMMTAFAEHPDQWEALRADRSLIPNAVEEALRYRPVTPLLTRLATQPLTRGDVEIEPGTLVSLAAVIANRDPSFNQGDPTEFDVRRVSPRHLSFGHGPHFCLGAALARLELAEFLAALLDELPTVEIVGDVPRRPVMGVYGVKNLVLARS